MPVSSMVKNIVSYGIPLPEAVYMANQSPSAHLGLYDRGVLEIGKKADIVLLDKCGNLISVYKNGCLVDNDNFKCF
jgi:N-acetylglucosamine-6-phosphate deacetylase